MPLPNLIIIGAMKCGTTSLHFQLRHHPQIAMSRSKELNFFVESRNWRRGVEWYAARFSSGTAIRGESSPGYSNAARFPGVPGRMHSVLPDARLVYMVRDPIERLISQWVHTIAEGTERRPLADAAADELYIDGSRYWRQISAYLEHYSPSRILVVAMEDLSRDQPSTVRRVLEFLDVDPDVPLPDLRKHRSDRKRLRTSAGEWLYRSALERVVNALPQWARWRVMRDFFGYWPLSRPFPRPPLSARDRGALAERLRDDAARFRAFAGREFADWSV
ncbi:MAG TPA: sulfotransferase [Gemmatimonadota bacterium]|nr:sulfotransferase [Gemmatimonadota bacterium]